MQEAFSAPMKLNLQIDKLIIVLLDNLFYDN